MAPVSVARSDALCLSLVAVSVVGVCESLARCGAAAKRGLISHISSITHNSKQEPNREESRTRTLGVQALQLLQAFETVAPQPPV